MKDLFPVGKPQPSELETQYPMGERIASSGKDQSFRGQPVSCMNSRGSISGRRSTRSMMVYW